MRIQKNNNRSHLTALFSRDAREATESSSEPEPSESNALELIDVSLSAEGRVMVLVRSGVRGHNAKDGRAMSDISPYSWSCSRPFTHSHKSIMEEVADAGLTRRF